jgi:hypothetical protein
MTKQLIRINPDKIHPMIVKEGIKFLTLLAILYTCISLIAPIVHAENITISNETTETTIKWLWTNTTVTGVENISIDGYKLCNFDPYATNFILSELEPKTEHSITVYANGTSATQTTETDENLVSFLISYYLIQVIGLIIVIVSLPNRIGVLAWLGFFITGIGFIITMPESVSNYLFIITNAVLLLFTLLTAILETRGN